MSTREMNDIIHERVVWLDVLKGIGIILVVLGHVSSNQIIYQWVYSFHMPIFFFAAGWLYKKKTILEDLKHRFDTIVIPYLAFGFLVLLYWELIEKRFRTASMSLIEAIVGILRGQYEYLEFNVHLWFLPAFFVTVIFYNILRNIGGKKLAYTMSIIMSLVFCFFTLPSLPWGIDRVFKYIIFFVLGDVLSENQTKHFTEKIAMSLKVGCTFILFIINFGLAYYGLTTGVMWYVTATIGVTACVMLSMIVDYAKVIQYLGRISLVVLCVHGPIYRIITKLVSMSLHMSTDAVRKDFLCTMVIVAITLAICSAGYEILSRYMPWMIGKHSMK